ncbi:hypothetical protein [Marinomonas epiphytica]
MPFSNGSKIWLKMHVEAGPLVGDGVCGYVMGTAFPTAHYGLRLNSALRLTVHYGLWPNAPYDLGYLK